MNKITLLKIALLCSLFSVAQNIDTTKYQKVSPSDTIKNYYNQNNNTSGDSIKNYYPPDQNQQQGQPQDQQPKQYQPDKSYPTRNQRGGNSTNTTKQKQQSTSSKDIMEKLYFGAYTYLTSYGISGYGSVVYYELSPHVGYKLNDMFSAGVQILYNNSIQSGGGYPTVQYPVYGGGVFARAVYRNFFAQVEYDILSIPQNYLGNVVIKRSISDEKMAGLGYKRTYDKLSFYFMMMYDFSPEKNSPYYYNPLVYRIGFSWNW